MKIAPNRVHLTLGILRGNLKQFLRLSIFRSDGFAVRTPAQVTQTVGLFEDLKSQKERYMSTGLNWKEIHKNVFFIIRNQDEGLIYSPLQGKFFSADGEAQETVKEYIADNTSNDYFFQSVLDEAGISRTQENPETPQKFPYKPTGVMLSLSNLCNLRCVYCYAEAGRIQPKALEENTIRQSIKSFEFAIETNENSVEIAFHGTGETLVNGMNS
ncbi:MAG: hypothetical protein IPP55_17940 [Anaerolineales bacterium]|nr:hypothetical protein [Anaerolineales bacterium]